MEFRISALGTRGDQAGKLHGHLLQTVIIKVDGYNGDGYLFEVIEYNKLGFFYKPNQHTTYERRYIDVVTTSKLKKTSL